MKSETRRSPSGKVRVAIVGVGNCASSLVQGVEYYRDASDDQPVPGLMHTTLGGYHIGDIEFSAAFDISSTKVGQDLAKAIVAEPNNTCRFTTVPKLGIEVQRGPTLDGLGPQLADVVVESSDAEVNVADILRETETDVVVCYLPVGSEQAVTWYAEQALQAGCALVNCVPVFLASRPEWAQRFTDAGLPLIGDDIKSQVGATIVHRVLANLLQERGVHLDRTYQLNFGGNTDFLNMLDRDRLQSKKISKTQSVASQIGHELPEGDTHVGPSDHVPWLGDRKWCYIRLEGTTFGDVPLSCELKLEVWDSPNSAGVVIDAVRCAALGLDRKLAGPLIGPSSYFMKSPPQQFTDSEAHWRTEVFIRGEEPAEVAAEVAAAGGQAAAGDAGDRNGHKQQAARRDESTTAASPMMTSAGASPNRNGHQLGETP